MRASLWRSAASRSLRLRDVEHVSPGCRAAFSRPGSAHGGRPRRESRRCCRLAARNAGTPRASSDLRRACAAVSAMTRLRDPPACTMLWKKLGRGGPFLRVIPQHERGLGAHVQARRVRVGPVDRRRSAAAARRARGNPPTAGRGGSSRRSRASPSRGRFVCGAGHGKSYRQPRDKCLKAHSAAAAARFSPPSGRGTSDREPGDLRAGSAAGAGRRRATSAATGPPARDRRPRRDSETGLPQCLARRIARVAAEQLVQHDRGWQCGHSRLFAGHRRRLSRRSTVWFANGPKRRESFPSAAAPAPRDQSSEEERVETAHEGR